MASVLDFFVKQKAELAKYKAKYGDLPSSSGSDDDDGEDEDEEEEEEDEDDEGSDTEQN
jgi:hypothetical protein